MPIPTPEDVRTDVASRGGAMRLAALLDTPESAAPETGRSAEHAPRQPDVLSPAGHWLLFTPTAGQRELGPDGHPVRDPSTQYADLPRRMWAGSNIRYHSPIRIGSPVTRRTTTQSVQEKQGRSGRLAFVKLRHELFTPSNLALVEHQTIVYREATVDPVNSSGPAASAPAGRVRGDSPAPGGWEWAAPERPDEVALFRYSALTFNGHRIHYDLPYATLVEGYPGLVVHGPYLATLIVEHFRRQHPRATIGSFSFTVKSPAFAGELIHICGRAGAPGSEELAIIGPNDTTLVTAEIGFR
ncbi:3-methylfumaryl-CoA hydratase [Mycolicibacterium mucogenicum 261Sha1.1M5]|nr:3-methylfumaryl-CoA hydratase [Mycolicibacterium mucogenicum 261Sha1.1M5]